MRCASDYFVAIGSRFAACMAFAVGAENSMFELRPPNPAWHRVCYILLAGGGLLLILGVLTGLMKPGASILLFASLAISTALFIGAAAVLMRHRAGNAVGPVQAPAAPEGETVNPRATEPQPDSHSQAVAEAQIAADGHADVKPGCMPSDEASARLEVRPRVKADAPPEVEPVTPDAVAATRVVEVKAPATAVMNMTLSEILLAALRKEPELAARIVAQAVLQEDKLHEGEEKATHPARG
jgi:hypothetical protein